MQLPHDVQTRYAAIFGAEMLLIYHAGVSTAGLPFSPPTNFRTVDFPAKTIRQRTTMREGRCHKCKKWIALDTVKKDVDVNVWPGCAYDVHELTRQSLGQGAVLVEACRTLPRPVTY